MLLVQSTLPYHSLFHCSLFADEQFTSWLPCGVADTKLLLLLSMMCLTDFKLLLFSSSLKDNQGSLTILPTLTAGYRASFVTAVSDRTLGIWASIYLHGGTFVVSRSLVWMLFPSIFNLY